MIYTLSATTVPLANQVTFLQFNLKAESLRPSFIIPPTSLDFFRNMGSGDLCVVMDALCLSYFKDQIRNFNSKWFTNNDYDSIVFYGVSTSSVTRIVTYARSEKAIRSFDLSKDLYLVSNSPVDFFLTLLDNEEIVSKEKLVVVLPEWTFHESFISQYAEYIVELLKKRSDNSVTLLVTTSTNPAVSVTRRLSIEICNFFDSFRTRSSVISVDVSSRAVLCNFFFSETDAETFDDWCIEYSSGRPGRKNLDLLLMTNDSFQMMKKPYFSESGKIECRGKFKPDKTLKAGETINIEFLLLHEPGTLPSEIKSVKDVRALSPCNETILSLEHLPQLLQTMNDYRQLVTEKKLTLPSIPVNEKESRTVVTSKILSIYCEIVQLVKTSFNLSESASYYNGSGCMANGLSVSRGVSYMPNNLLESYHEE